MFGREYQKSCAPAAGELPASLDLTPSAVPTVNSSPHESFENSSAQATKVAGTCVGEQRLGSNGDTAGPQFSHAKKSGAALETEALPQNQQGRKPCGGASKNLHPIVAVKYYDSPAKRLVFDFIADWLFGGIVEVEIIGFQQGTKEDWIVFNDLLTRSTLCVPCSIMTEPRSTAQQIIGNAFKKNTRRSVYGRCADEEARYCDLHFGRARNSRPSVPGPACPGSSELRTGTRESRLPGSTSMSVREERDLKIVWIGVGLLTFAAAMLLKFFVTQSF